MCGWCSRLAWLGLLGCTLAAALAAFEFRMPLPFCFVEVKRMALTGCYAFSINYDLSCQNSYQSNVFDRLMCCFGSCDGMG